MAETKRKLGRVPCKNCGEPVMVKENDAGTLSMACDDCGFSVFAKKGEKSNQKIRQQLPAAAPATGSASGTAQPSQRQAFSLDQL